MKRAAIAALALLVTGSAWGYRPSGGGTPGGSSGQVQYNNGGAFGGLASASYGSAAKAIPAGVDYVTTCNNSDAACTTGTWSAPTTWTLPVHTALADGFTITVSDPGGFVTNTNTLTIAPNAGDTMTSGGSVSNLVLSAGYLGIRCTLAGSNWNCVPQSLQSGTAGQILVSQGAGTTPAFVSASNDATVAATGAVTVASFNNGNTLPAVVLNNQALYANGTRSVTAGTLPVAAGGTGGTTGKAAGGNLSVVYIPCNPTLSALTGTVSETALAVCTVPAGLIGTKGALRYMAYASVPANANAKTLRVRFGAVNDLSGTILNSQASSSTTLGIQDVGMVYPAGATNSQTSVTSFFSVAIAAPVTTAVDTTAASYLVLSGQLANGGDNITPLQFMVEYIPPGGT